MESFSRYCRCLTQVVKAMLQINYDYIGKVSARIAEVKSKPRLGKPGSRLTGLKISHVIVFSPGWNNKFHLEFQPGLKFSLYTHFYRIREEGGSGRPIPYRSFENRWHNIDILYIILKEILWRFQLNLNFSKIFWFRDFKSNFREMNPQRLHNGCPKEFQTFKIWTYCVSF